MITQSIREDEAEYNVDLNMQPEEQNISAEVVEVSGLSFHGKLKLENATYK